MYVTKIPHYVEGRGLGRRVEGCLVQQCLDIRDGCRLLHCTENSTHIFPEMKLHGLVPNFHIPVSVCDLYIPVIGLPILLQQIGGLIILYYYYIIVLFWK
jgi:hypothetical protein